jgi:hypothetical protein
MVGPREWALFGNAHLECGLLQTTRPVEATCAVSKQTHALYTVEPAGAPNGGADGAEQMQHLVLVHVAST